MAGEFIEAQFRVLTDAVRNLFVAADERRAGAATDQPDARPQVGRDRERLPVKLAVM